MAVPRRHGVSHFKEEATHFFKIILDDSLRDGKLKIPNKFWRKFGKGIPTSVELLAPCGAVWKVQVTKSGREAWLQNGWREFAAHYSLSHGHLVVFRYEGDGKFHIVIFDMTATEIDYPIFVSNGESSNPREGDKDETGDDDNPIEILDSSEFPSRKRREISPLPCPKSSKSIRTNSTPKKLGERHGELLSDSQRCQQQKVCRRIQPLTADEKRRALRRATAFRSSDPFFVVAMQPSYVNPGYSLKIPVGFVKKYLVKKHGHGKVILQILDGSSWIVGYKVMVQSDRRKCGRFNCNWKAFVQENSLEVGDVCVFELTDRAKLLFRVIVYRNDDGPYCFPSQGMATTTTPPPKGLNLEANCSVQPPTPNEVTCQRPLAFNSENPFFLVVMKPYYVNLKKCSLYIPEEFAKRHLKGCHGEVQLRVQGGRSWDVGYNVQLTHSRLIAEFDSRWKAFVQDNGLKAGDSCFFELIQSPKTSFSVVIKRAKEDANYGLSTGHGDEGRKLRSETNLQNILKHSCSVTNPATEAANKFVSECPFFLVVVRSYYLKCSVMRLPIGFFRKYIKRNDTPVTLKTAGKSWPTKIASRYGQCSLTAGWDVFAKENSLQPGDICAFELIKRSDIVLKVSFFRCSMD